MRIFLLLAILICITTSSAKDIYADSYGSIQNAINAANDGDTVYVKGGIYNESIRIDKSIKLIGSYDGNETILNGIRINTAISVFADNVKITGFTILNPNHGINLYSSNNSSIYNNTIENVNDAINVYSGSNVSIYNNSIANCCDFGIYTYKLNYSKILGNKIIKTSYGIYFYKSNHNVVYRNNVVNNCHDGISLYYSENNSIDSNKVMICRDSGISLSSSNNNSIYNNFINEVFRGMIIYYSKYNEIKNSTIINYYNYGIDLYTAAYNEIINNTIENTLKFVNNVIRLDTSNNNTIYRNNFFEGYKLYLYRSDSNSIFLNNFVNTSIQQYESKNKLNTTRVDYTYHGKNYTNCLGNYYNNYKGKDANRDGIGDSAYKMDSILDNYPLMEPYATYYIKQDTR